MSSFWTQDTLTIATKSMKYIEMNLIMNAENLSEKNSLILLKDMKENLSKLNNIQCLCMY